ncbi:RfbX Membrane protein involved in the export of O-antigen and teichoic acid [Methylophilaceae bacterium]
MIVALITIPLYLKIIGYEKYGFLVIVWAVIGYISFFDLGLGRSLTKQLSSLKNSFDKEASDLAGTAYFLTLTSSVVGALILYCIAKYAIFHFASKTKIPVSELNELVSLMLISMPIFLSVSIFSSALQAKYKFVELNLILTIGGIFFQVMPLIFAFLGYTKLSNLIVSMLFVRLLVAITLFFKCKRYVPLLGFPKLHLNHIKPLIGFGGWVTCISIFNSIMGSIDKIIISSMMGVRFVSHYSVPFDLVSKGMLISTSLSVAIFPKLSSSESRESKKTVEKTTKILLAIMTPLVVIGIACVKPFMNLWIGERFAESSNGIAEIILVGVWINSAVSLSLAKLIASDNKVKAVGLMYVAELPIYVLFIYIGISEFGLIGAAGAWSLRVLIDAFLILFLAEEATGKLKTLFIPFMIVISALLISIQVESNQLFRITFFIIVIFWSIAYSWRIFFSGFMIKKPT